MQDIKENTLEQITNLLYILNDKMEEYNLEKTELYAIGGYSCMVYNYKKMTQDIDNYTKEDIYDIRRLAYDIGIQYDAYGWFSNLNSFSDRGTSPPIQEYLKIKNSFIEYLSLSKIIVYIQSPACLLYMKLCTYRNKDIDDIKSILKANNLISKEDILNFINDYLVINFKSLEEINNNIDKILKEE